MATETVDVQKAARDLAGALEGEWGVFPGHWATRDAFVRSADGEGLHVQQVLSENRLGISGEKGDGLRDFWPTGEGRAYLRHEITVSASKTAARIARDVERRLLPAYRAALAEAREAKTAHDGREAADAELAAELAGILGGRAVAHLTHTARVGEWGDPLNGTVEVQRDEVVFKLRVPRGLALGLAARVTATP